MKFAAIALFIALGVIAQSLEVSGWWGSRRRRRSQSSSGGGGRHCFVQICAGNPSNTIRGCDSKGCGNYGASRDGGRRTHKGIDIVCSAGSSVYSPFPARVLRRSNPYMNSNAAYNTGIYLQGTGTWADFKVKMWYVTKNVGNGNSLSAGSFIGYMTDRAGSSGMTNHVHVQLEKNGWIVDPTNNIC